MLSQGRREGEGAVPKWHTLRLAFLGGVIALAIYGLVGVAERQWWMHIKGGPDGLIGGAGRSGVLLAECGNDGWIAYTKGPSEWTYRCPEPGIWPFVKIFRAPPFTRD